ncbi:MAG: hypothetical protein WD795_00620 [Woeseia sp.]
MAQARKIESTEEAWDSGKLGRDADFAKVSEAIKQSRVEKALGLKPISIRLHQAMIDDLKVIAEIHRVGYQPLMRQILQRFIDCEKKQIIRDYLAQQQKDIEEEQDASDSSKVA